MKKERYSRTISIARNYFIESYQKGLNPFEEIKSLDELEYKKRFKIIDMDEPLLEALAKLNTLILYLWSDISWEEATQNVKTHYHVFSPRMHPWFSYLPGTSKKIDYHFLQISNEFKREMKSEQIDVKKRKY